MSLRQNRIKMFLEDSPSFRSLWPSGQHEEKMIPDCVQPEEEFDQLTWVPAAEETRTENWTDKFRVALERLVRMIVTEREQFLRLAKLEEEVQALKTLAGQLRDSQSIVVPITTLDPEPFELLCEIRVVVQPTDDGYLATAFDVNIGITGDTQEEAVGNLKELIVDIFDELEHDEGKLGPVPARQLAVLRSLIKRRE